MHSKQVNEYASVVVKFLGKFVKIEASNTSFKFADEKSKETDHFIFFSEVNKIPQNSQTQPNKVHSFIQEKNQNSLSELLMLK